jgi:hypothetical protein
MKFLADTGRKHDTQNQFQELRKVIKHGATTLCTGPRAQAAQRRKDMIKILTEAVGILKEELYLYEPKIITPVKTETK